MNRYIIEGGRELSGKVRVHGSKNATLPILAGCIINSDKSIVHNCPHLSDVESSIEILRLLGCRAEFSGDDLFVDSSSFMSCDIPRSVMEKTRSSTIFAGAMLARCGRAYISGSGGCSIGKRPIDLHLSAFSKLGIDIDETPEGVECIAGRITPSEITLEFPSVGATENIMLAVSLTPGRTIIKNPAKEPEIINLADYLRSVGVKISGDGSDEIHIEGTLSPKCGEVTVIADRIVTATYISAVASAGGSIIIEKANPHDLSSVIALYRKMGLSVICSAKEIEVSKTKELCNPSFVATEPYPGIPTDCQPLIGAVMAGSIGMGVIKENIFENRFEYCRRLEAMGAEIKQNGNYALFVGGKNLRGAVVDACDLRCGASLAVASLGASGISEITNVSYIERGYENLCRDLNFLGAHAERK